MPEFNMDVPFEYIFDGKIGGIVITRYTGTNTDVVIPPKINRYPVVCISYGVFGGWPRVVTSIAIPDSVKIIKERAFGENTELTVTYKGKSYERRRYENEDDKYYHFDFPREFYAALWNGMKFEYCNECPYFSWTLNYDTGANWYFYDCYRVKKNVYGYKTVTASIGEPLDDIESPDWCPLTQDENEVIGGEVMTLVDKAIIFATKKHSGMKRKGTDTPYIVHPLEAVSIAAGITNDMEILAAAALHDIVEDTPVTMYEIEVKFGKRAAELIAADNEDKMPDIPPAESWKIRKDATIALLQSASYDEKIIVLADKLSNIRTLCRDVKRFGDKSFEKFNQKDKKMHEWYYREIAKAIAALSDSDAYKEFCSLINEVFVELNI